MKGYHADFANGCWGKLYEEGGRGALPWKYKDKAPEIKADDQVEQLSQYSQRNETEAGTVTIELDDKDPAKSAKEGVARNGSLQQAANSSGLR